MISILVPTHNRHKYISRVIKYYSRYDLQLIIVDSTSETYDASDIPANVFYLHYPHCTFAEKIIKANFYIQYSLVALCADDDFFYYSAMLEAFSIMSKNENIVLFSGEYEFFEVTKSSIFYSNPSAFPSTNILLNYPKEDQIKHFMSNYSQILWSVYRKNLLFNIMQAVKVHNPKNDNFIELTVAAIALSHGNIYFRKKYVGVREVTKFEHWGLRHPSIIHCKKDEVESFIDTISKETSLVIANLVIENYYKFLSKRSKMTFRFIRYFKSKLKFSKICKEGRNTVYDLLSLQENKL